MNGPKIEPYHSEDYELWVFGARTCTVCGETFAANLDYFAPCKKRQSGLTSDCKNCRRERSRRRQQDPEVRAKKQKAERARRQRMKEAS